jgi:hypothetical protein
MSASARPARTWMSFRRIVDIPFGTCVAALDSGELTGHDGGRRAGRVAVCGPAEQDPDCGTCRVQVRLPRGLLGPPLRMRLQADHWSSSPPRTSLELIPCGPVRPSAAYFRAGHRLLDQLARSLARPVPAPRPDCAASQPYADQGQPGPGRRPARSAAPARYRALRSRSAARGRPAHGPRRAAKPAPTCIFMQRRPWDERPLLPRAALWTVAHQLTDECRASPDGGHRHHASVRDKNLYQSERKRGSCPACHASYKPAWPGWRASAASWMSPSV